MRLGLKSAFLASVALGVISERAVMARFPEHDKAVEMARSNNPQDAVKILEKLHQEHPEDQDVVHDLVAVTLWAGDDKKSREIFFSKVNPQEAPLYVLESAAKASRNLGNIQEAKRLYEIGQTRDSQYKAFEEGLNALEEDQKVKKSVLRCAKKFKKPNLFSIPSMKKP